MASNTFDDSRDCVVCYTTGKETRILECLHHFCDDCLESISQPLDNRKSIKCPICRQLTTLPRNELPIHKPTNYGTEIKNFIDLVNVANCKPKDRPCTFGGTHAPATHSCIDCKVNLCELCKAKHSMIEDKVPNTHKARPISEVQFCPTHQEYFAQWICLDCKIGLCVLCIIEHSTHPYEDISVAATQGKAILQGKILDVNFEEELKAKGMIGIFESKLERYWVTRSAAINSAIEKAEQVVLNLKLERLRSTKDVCKERLKVRIMKKHVKEYIESKESLVSCVSNLVGDVSNADVALHVSQLPDCAIQTIKENMPEILSVKIFGSAAMEKLARAMSDATALMRSALNEMNDTDLFDNSFSELKLAEEVDISTNMNVVGCEFNPGEKNVSMRVTVKGNGCEILNYRCNIGMMPSYEIPPGCTTSCIGTGLGLDQRRGHYICLTSSLRYHYIINSYDILSFSPENDSENFSAKEIDLTADGNFDYFCSNEDLDLFIMTSLSKKKVFVCQTGTGSIKQDFKPKTSFESPKHVSSGNYFTGTEFVQAIAITDEDCIKVLDMKGELLNTFSVVREENGQIESLRRPAETLFDHRGQLLVLDRRNFRLVRFWVENGYNQSRILYRFDRSKCKGAGPHFLACDRSNRLVFVVDKFEDQYRLLVLEENQ